MLHWIDFSEACIGGCNDLEAVSPKDEESQEDMVGRGIKGQVASYKPSAKEKEEHEKSHIPFRRWCEFSVMGKSKNASHKSSDKEEKNQVPTISYEYALPKSKDVKEEEIKCGRY